MTLSGMGSASSDASADEYKQLYDEATALVQLGVWECRIESNALIWSDGVYDLFDIPRGSTVQRTSILDLYEDGSRHDMQQARAAALRTGGRFCLDARIRTSRNVGRWMRLTAQAVHAQGRPIRLFGTKQDITHEKELWQGLKQLADCDSLTGLANRRVFEVRCRELADADRHDGAMSALALVDLDHFKQINDRFGHAAGDECLRQFALRLQNAFDGAVLIARIGGDEFAVLLHAPFGRVQLAHVLDRALRMLSAPVEWKRVQIAVAASIGVTILRQADGQDTSQAFAEADAALYIAKSAGRNAVRVFGETIGDLGSSPMKLLRAAGTR